MKIDSFSKIFTLSMLAVIVGSSLCLCFAGTKVMASMADMANCNKQVKQTIATNYAVKTNCCLTQTQNYFYNNQIIVSNKNSERLLFTPALASFGISHHLEIQNSIYHHLTNSVSPPQTLALLSVIKRE